MILLLALFLLKLFPQLHDVVEVPGVTRSIPFVAEPLLNLRDGDSRLCGQATDGWLVRIRVVYAFLKPVL